MTPISSISTIEDLSAYDTIVIPGYLTPVKVATAYNMPTNSNGANIKVGVLAHGGGFKQSDLNSSMADLGLTAPNVTVIGVDGATNNFVNTSDVSFETTLDLYCVAGIAPAANIVLFIGNVTNTSRWANLIQRAVDEDCDIITHSYSTHEGFGPFLETPLSNAAKKGITFFTSTGDYGSRDKSGVEGANYPATSANVIAVGGTNLTVFSGNSIRSSEYASTQSGGGISSIISLPSWQTGLTYTPYFKANSTPGATANLTMRGVPDIAAAMNTYTFYFDGNVAGASGTSASTPIMAGMFARYISLMGGRRPVTNAIHPILYGNLAVYYDINVGGNNASYVNGYATSANWDPVTGVGVPNSNQVYQMVASGGTTVKTAANTWSYLANVRVKTDATTWSNVRAIWTKTINGWKQTF
jgi:hypothetical protein